MSREDPGSGVWLVCGREGPGSLRSGRIPLQFSSVQSEDTSRPLTRPTPSVTEGEAGETPTVPTRPTSPRGVSRDEVGRDEDPNEEE